MIAKVNHVCASTATGEGPDEWWQVEAFSKDLAIVDHVGRATGRGRTTGSALP